MTARKGTYPAARKPKDTRTPERKAFDAVVRTFERAITELSESAEASDDRQRLATKLFRALDRAREKFSRAGLFDQEGAATLYDVLGLQLRARVRDAVEESGKNYRAHLESESARLSRQIREDSASQGGYKKELELSRRGVRR